MIQLLADFQSYHACEILLVVAAVLILVDYFFATDWPAHVGYLCIAGSVFFLVWEGALKVPAMTWGTSRSLLLAAGVLLALAVLHRLLFRRFLENAPGTPGYESDEGPAEPGIPATDGAGEDPSSR